MDDYERTMLGGNQKAQSEFDLPQTLCITLSFTKGAIAGQKFRITKSVVTVGRKPPAEIIIPDPTVSSSHARFEIINGIVDMFDCNSTNGTYLSGQKITKATVNNMDEVGFGDVRALLTVVNDPYGLYSDDSELPSSLLQTNAAMADAPFEHCLLGAYSPALKSILENIVKDKKLAKDWMTVNHGGEFIEAASIGFRDKKPFDLIITEVRMPLMGGIQTSIAFRHMEKAFGVKSPAPIIFFSEAERDTNLDKAVEYLKPARYLQTYPDLTEFRRRAEALVDKLIQIGQQRKSSL